MGNCFVLAAEEIVAVMDGQCGVQRGDPAAEERRRAALVPFIGAGMPLTPPSLRCRQRRWLARRAIAVRQARPGRAPMAGRRGPTAGDQGERCRLSGWEHGADLRSREGPKCHLARSDGL